MATLTPTPIFATGQGAVSTVETLSGTDDFVLKGSRMQELLFINSTGSSQDITLIGDNIAAPYDPEGALGGGVDRTGGATITINDGEFININVQAYRAFLNDTNNLPQITGGAGVSVILFEQA